MIETLDTQRLPIVVKSWQIPQFLRFSLIGVSNTMIDIGAFTLLSWLLPTSSLVVLASYNILAYSLGATNSFLWNRQWTFGKHGILSLREVRRFIVATLLATTSNTLLLASLAFSFPRLATGTGLFPILLKGIAIGGTFLLSFVVMRLWVFLDVAEEKGYEHLPQIPYPYTLSLVLPAYNEAENIRTTIAEAESTLSRLVTDYEIIVVNDGSKDNTGAVVASIMKVSPRVFLVHHQVNQGYGAALVSGFRAATKGFTLFMDSDGQFRTRSLTRLLPWVGEYDGVFGYRLKRQDTWVRKLNAWCWKWLVWFTFGVKARDIDCAFKLFHTWWLQENLPQTRGAMINTELLYRFARTGERAKEVGVPHYPRRAGKATGAKPSVIFRALQELGKSAITWSKEQS